MALGRQQLIVALVLCLGLPLARASDSDPQKSIPPVPAPRQLAWQELEYCAFFHFGINTFTDREWGEGSESEKLFDPKELDCKQWVKVAKDAGMKGVILTAKHHDGFCLWPSKWTEHSVKNSPWKDGKGDVVRELSDACHEAGMKFGVYLSPWDRNQPCYGDSDKYNDYYVAQLTELLTNYGEIFEVWFDGACGEGPNGKKQVYDWKRYIETVRKLQPNAVMFSDAGPDVRWVGNENGFAGETCWSMLKRDKFYPGTPDYKELTTGHSDGDYWVPAECDVSIRPGWFYHQAEDDKVKSVDDLMKIWYGSVGRNGSLLLNIPPDRRGLVNEHDVARLMEFRERRDSTFQRDLAKNAPTSYDKKDDDGGERTLEIRFEHECRIDHVVIAEDISRGQRETMVEIEIPRSESNASRDRVASGTTIGHKRIFQFKPVMTNIVYVRLGQTLRGPHAIASVQVYGP